MKLFPDENLVGVFRGFSSGGMEFHADLVLAYQSDFQNVPMHGQFVLVQLETEDEAVLGRITGLHAEGRLASSSGDDFALRALAERRSIPENLRDQYLKYRVGIRVLGVLRLIDAKIVFVASHRRLPHVGSPVAFLADDVLCDGGGELGYLALGEFIYAGSDTRLLPEPWMIVKSPAVMPKFDVDHLVRRRSFVFARAGFGKSNLVKLLFSSLYATTPTVHKKPNRDVPVGTVIFDPDGEYFWPDDTGRPGLCDVPHLEQRLVVFTNKKGDSPFYQSFVAGPIKLDIRRLPASSVVSIALPVDRQTQQNVIKLRRLSPPRWQELVDLIHAGKMLADDSGVARILNLDVARDTAELGAAKSNMVNIVEMLHDPSSLMLDSLITALRAGTICVVDLSQMRGHRGRILAGLILQKIFDQNQAEWTKANPQTMPVIAVIEEAQSVLSNTSASPEDPYVVWTKEGRKYDLGSVLVTQQPGSIDAELLSQGDNWFIFHLLSAQDLLSVKRANSHFSDDLLTSLLNEPIRGNGVFWSSAWERSYPIPFAPCCSSGPTRREIPGTTNPPRRHTRRCCESRQLTWWLPAWLRSRRAVVMSPTPSRTPVTIVRPRLRVSMPLRPSRKLRSMPRPRIQRSLLASPVIRALHGWLSKAPFAIACLPISRTATHLHAHWCLVCSTRYSALVGGVASDARNVMIRLGR